MLAWIFLMISKQNSLKCRYHKPPSNNKEIIKAKNWEEISKRKI